MSEDAIDRVRRICMALPEATEKVAWGEPTFRVRDRIFVMFAGNHHQDGRVAVWLKAPVGMQELLVRSDPDTYFVPPYVGPKGWVGVVLKALDDKELREHAIQSYCLVAPRKLQAAVVG